MATEHLEFMRVYTGAALHDDAEPLLDIAWHPEVLMRLHAGDDRALRNFVAILVYENTQDSAPHDYD